MKTPNQLLSVFLMALLLPLHGCAVTYSANAITGTVVNGGTGAPLEGVNIVATWEIARRRVGDDETVLHVMETVSDKNGDYGFSAWGPILLPPMANFQQGADPRIVYFKSGYWPAAQQNIGYVDISERPLPLGEFRGNGKTVKLEKWDGKDVEEYASRVSGMSGDLRSERGLWRSYPRMLFTLIEEQERLKQLGDRFGLSGICPGCFGPEYLEFIRKFGK